jgi:hypothetical protein
VVGRVFGVQLGRGPGRRGDRCREGAAGGVGHGSGGRAAGAGEGAGGGEHDRDDGGIQDAQLVRWRIGVEPAVVPHGERGGPPQRGDAGGLCGPGAGRRLHVEAEAGRTGRVAGRVAVPAELDQRGGEGDVDGAGAGAVLQPVHQHTRGGAHEGGLQQLGRRRAGRPRVVQRHRGGHHHLGRRGQSPEHPVHGLVEVQPALPHGVPGGQVEVHRDERQVAGAVGAAEPGQRLLGVGEPVGLDQGHGGVVRAQQPGAGRGWLCGQSPGPEAAVVHLQGGA